ncbi:MAG: 4-(cytidine 5'-diphospho)-2-C-methyl-D-erythritol kinase [Candidatus Limnocylindria bacterium]
MFALTVEAPAKINLSLAVTGRRSDGYHELAGVMALIDLTDTLTLTPGCSGLRVNAPPSEEIPVSRADNLAWRGLVAGAGGDPDIACMTLEKRIPMGAGLGGGSSDAGAGWRLGRRLADRPDVPTVDELTGELAGIGADVPFFATMEPAAYVTGIGERVRSVAPREALVVLALPRFRLSTAAVFAELSPSDWSGEAPDAQATPGWNDLLGPAARLRPELDDLLRDMRTVGAEPHLSGSGPCCFALTDDPDRAAAVVAAMTARGVCTMQTRLLTSAYEIAELSAEHDTEEHDDA